MIAATPTPPFPPGAQIRWYHHTVHNPHLHLLIKAPLHHMLNILIPFIHLLLNHNLLSCNKSHHPRKVHLSQLLQLLNLVDLYQKWFPHTIQRKWQEVSVFGLQGRGLIESKKEESHQVSDSQKSVQGCVDDLQS